MALLPYAIGWAVLLVVVIILAIYHQKLAAQEDDSIHVSDATGAEKTAQQVAITKKLGVVELWGKTLTALLVLSGLALGGWFLYSAWTSTTTGIGG